MYDFYSQKSNYPFKGKVFNEYRYFQSDTAIEFPEYTLADVTSESTGTYYVLFDGSYVAVELPEQYESDTEYYYKTNTIKQYKKGDKNPYFRLKPSEFVFNITSMNVVDKKQPINGLVVKSEQMSIDTKYKHPWFKQGGYIEYDGRLWVIKTAEEEKGPQKSVYSFFAINSLSTIKMLVEEVQE